MRKNTASQVIGAQMVSATDGSAFTGSVTVAVTGDGGTQATGSVGSGACTHEGGGYHTYAPAQAETNYNLVAFTFSGTGAVPVTVQVYTESVDRHDTVRLGLTALPNAAADAAGGLPISDAGGQSIDVAITQIGAIHGKLPGKDYIAGTDNVDGNIEMSAAIGNFGGSVASVVGAVGSVTDGVTVSTNNDKTGYGLSSTAVQAIWDALTSALTTTGSIGKKLADWVVGTTQTGDAFARLGAPAGASVSADIAAAKAVVDATKSVTDKLDTALEDDGASGWQLTTLALENGAGGGGGSDWTADEKTAIRSILGIPGSGTTPADPSTGILDTIRDQTTSAVLEAAARAGVMGTWTDETGASFVLIITG